MKLHFVCKKPQDKFSALCTYRARSDSYSPNKPMKFKSNITTAIAAALLTFTGSGLAQTNWGSTGAVTVALTLTYSTEALQLKDENGKVLSIADGGGPTFQNSFFKETTTLVDGEPFPVKMVSTDEFGSKFGSWKWGNKEIIEWLVEGAILPQIGRAPYIAGWSILMTYDAEGNPMGAVARHTNKTMMPIDIAFAVEFAASAISWKTVRTDNMPPNGEPTSTETRSHTESYKAKASATVAFEFGEPIEVVGLLTGGKKVTPKTEGTGIDKMTTFVYTNSATKLDKVIGMSSNMELIEGSISVAPGVIVDMDAFNEPPL